METPRILLATPATGWMPSVSHFAIIAAMEYDWCHHRYILGHDHTHCTIVDEARNMIVRHFLERKSPDGKWATHLLFCDSDMLPPQDGIHRLVEVEGDIVCGLFTNRTFDSKTIIKPMVFKATEDGGYLPIEVKPQSFAELDAQGAPEVDACGMAWTLIRREVLEKVKAPWFNFARDDKREHPAGEDVLFCRAAKAEGFKVQCRLSCLVGHVGTFVFDVGDHWACLEDRKNT